MSLHLYMWNICNYGSCCGCTLMLLSLHLVLLSLLRLILLKQLAKLCIPVWSMLDICVCERERACVWQREKERKQRRRKLHNLDAMNACYLYSCWLLVYIYTHAHPSLATFLFLSRSLSQKCMYIIIICVYFHYKHVI